MKIECPSCHLSGNMPDHEIPMGGRQITCPKCKSGFQVKKEASAAGHDYQMNLCPNCQYSTFSEETFSVCPKCGMDGKKYRDMITKRQEAEQLRRDEEKFHQSLNTNTPPPPQSRDEEVERDAAPAPVLLIAWICILVAVGLLVYGGLGLRTFYGTDWVALLAETTYEQVSKESVFFARGLLPWLAVVYGVMVLFTAAFFLKLINWARVGLEGVAWLGSVFMALYEIYEFVVWVRLSSSSPTFGYYFTGILDVLLMTALWVVPPALLIRYLRSEEVRKLFGG